MGVGKPPVRVYTTGDVTLVSYGGSNDRIILGLNRVRCDAAHTALVSSGTPGGSNITTANNQAVAA